ncbi:MAG: response regulator transcription factor [Eubacteriales bacterium]|nr:response regulator transcription factor [Eubacteriales bacterium]
MEVKKKLLIVDDEEDIVEMLRSFFEPRGYLTLCAGNGEMALRQAEREPDIILLDINMPDMDGMEVCRRIRNFVSCPILFLTARIEEADKVQGFAAGGDDYIVKPFSLVELEARVAAHLRREVRRRNEAKVRFSGDVCIDYSQRTVTIKGRELVLPKKEFEIVELLSQNPGQVFDKERIYERIWGYDGQGDSSTVAEHIRRIRAKFLNYTDRLCIETVWGCGYKWKR